MTAMVRAFRARVLAIPSRTTRQLIGKTDFHEIHGLLEAEIESALRELSEYDPSKDLVHVLAGCQTQHYLQMPVGFAKLSANMATLCANGSASLCGELRGGHELGADMSRSKSTL